MNYNSFARQCLKRNRATKLAIVRVMGEVLRKEIAGICSDDFNSITRLKSKHSLKDFKTVISSILDELKGKAPTLLSLFRSCMKTKRPRRNTEVVIAVLASVICKHRRPSSCIIQRIISLILYTGHSSKQVSIVVLDINHNYDKRFRYFSDCRRLVCASLTQILSKLLKIWVGTSTCKWKSGKPYAQHRYRLCGNSCIVFFCTACSIYAEVSLMVCGFIYSQPHTQEIDALHAQIHAWWRFCNTS